MVRCKLNMDHCNRSTPIAKDAKPEEYDVNIRRNDVYNDICCAFD